MREVTINSVFDLLSLSRMVIFVTVGSRRIAGSGSVGKLSLAENVSLSSNELSSTRMISDT